MTPGLRQFLVTIATTYAILGFFVVAAASNKHSPPRRRNQFQLSWLNQSSTTEYETSTDGKRLMS